MYKIGLVRVLSNFDKNFMNSHGRIIEKNFPNIEVESMAIKDQPEGIHDEETEIIAIPKIIELVKENYTDKDAVIISCAGDPALQELRKEVKVPVIGAGESASLVSKIYGKKVGVVGITKKVPKSYKMIIGDDIVGKPYIEGIENTLDLMKDFGRERALKHCHNLKSLGAEVLVFACTGLSTIKIAPYIEKEIGLKVVDCVYAEGLMAYGACIRRNFYEKIK